MSPSRIYDVNTNTADSSSVTSQRLFSRKSPPSVDELKALSERKTVATDYPLCQSVESNIPIYDLAKHPGSNHDIIESLQNEWYEILHTGPGVFVLQNFQPDTSCIDQTNVIYDNIITHESTNSTGKGDHFAAAGLNSRIWNSFQKHAIHHPDSFLTYYSNPWLSHVSTAWLGPCHQLTAQVNIVHPGGKPQVPHRDYHLGFQPSSLIAQFPTATHLLTQHLTLQGAIAHSDMPQSSGPTRLLPYSQLHSQGYTAFRLPAFQDHFSANWVSLPLRKGDALFFNPALFHAAGENTTTGISRSANLLQISSAFGKPMEHIDTIAVIESCWDELMERFLLGGSVWTPEMQTIVSLMGNGYAFPTNLDRRMPSPGGMAPESEQDVLRRGLESRITKSEIVKILKKMRDDGLG